MSHESLLANIPLFESLNPDDFTALSERLQPYEFPPGEVIFNQGESGETPLFIIEDGAVEISYGEGKARVELATLYAGQYFGELSLFDGAPRSATATAVRASKLLALSREDFVDFIQRDPQAALLIMAEMGERLRRMNDLMSRQVSRNVNEELEEKSTLGQRVADRVAGFGGSWPFIFIFSSVMTVWMVVNIIGMSHFDPYPFILLNLCLSSVAALQAPIIMMSQNRQSAKDKLLSQNDYEVNLKSEMEIGQVLKNQAELGARLNVIEAQLSRSLSGGSPRTVEQRKPAEIG